MYILGISAYYHDSAAALIKDGEIIAAAQEELNYLGKDDNAADALWLRQMGIEWYSKAPLRDDRRGEALLVPLWPAA